MAYYSHLTIINSTPYKLIRDHHHSYQMDDWDSAFPNVIVSGSSTRIQIGFQSPLFGNWQNDGAEQVYLLENSASSFELQARASDGYHLWLDPTNMSNDGQRHDRIDMGWFENSELYIWIAGSNEGYLIRKWWLSDEA